VIHCAATVSFTLGLDESRAINVEGTRHLLDLAGLSAARGHFDCFTHVSTAYVAGDHRGTFAEHELNIGQDFRNAYERSKFEAESLVRDRGRRGGKLGDALDPRGPALLRAPRLGGERSQRPVSRGGRDLLLDQASIR
jgi:thioester reductase-like protein